MAGLIVRGQELPGPSGLVIQNFRMAGIPSLRNQMRNPRNEVNEVVVHETVTSSAKATVDVLQQRGLGVHLIVGPDGTVYQHADLVLDETWHASEHNPRSVGIETVNPFETKYRPAMSPWTNTLHAQWAGMEYVVPTPDQSESVALLLAWMSSPDSTLSVPKTWVGMRDKTMQLGRLDQSEQGPGIYAHHYFADHLDGPWLVLYAWLRLEAQLDQATAYAEAIRRASNTMTVDLSDYFTG